MTLLKKDFKEKDIQRIRNIIKGKYGDKTQTQIGFNKSQRKKYKEGDVWEENGKIWTIEDGIKISKTKLDIVKTSFKQPIVCPECNQRMKKKLDTKMFNIHNKCFDCVIKMETKLRLEGKYEEYSKNLIYKNLEFVKNELFDIKKDLKDNQISNKIINENSEEEHWNNQEQVNELLIQFIDKSIQDIEDKLNS